MARNPLTSSERRGILVVAGLALLVTACGGVLSLCWRPAPVVVSPEVEVLYHADSVAVGLKTDSPDDSLSRRQTVKEGGRRKVKKTEKERKGMPVRKRSMRDEDVPVSKNN